jgi:hypothetical protein
MGKNITRVGGNGDGQTTKVTNQIIVALNIEAVAEALLFAAKAGADPARVRQALMGGFASSKILEVHGERMAKRTFNRAFASTCIRRTSTSRFPAHDRWVWRCRTRRPRRNCSMRGPRTAARRGTIQPWYGRSSCCPISKSDRRARKRRTRIRTYERVVRDRQRWRTAGALSMIIPRFRETNAHTA